MNGGITDAEQYARATVERLRELANLASKNERFMEIDAHDLRKAAMLIERLEIRNRALLKRAKAVAMVEATPSERTEG